MNAPAPLSVVTVDFRSRVALRVNELRHQEAELDAALRDLTAPLREKHKEAFRKLNAARRESRRPRQSTVFTTRDGGIRLGYLWLVNREPAPHGCAEGSRFGHEQGHEARVVGQPWLLD